MPLNCLEEPLFTTKIGTGQTHLALPSLYSALMRDVVDDMPAVRPYQRQALHAFLVQVGALAHLEGNINAPALETSVWARLLRRLTANFSGDEPWSLVVEDVSKPGFLQSPVPEGTLNALKQRDETPDALDILVTSKNHDVKAKRMVIARPEHWFYALLTLQTMQGYLGAGNYGISRMNGGFASRPMVGLVPNGGMGARVRRDIKRLLQGRSDILNDNPAFAAVNGIGLVWMVPWNGDSPIAPKELDPFYVEVCRRVRLIREDTRIVALRAKTKSARIAFPKHTNGVTGDPWTPIDQRNTVRKALTVDGAGFHYKRVTDLLDARQYKAPTLQRWQEEDGTEGYSFVLTVMVRGQGGTDGFHERRIPLPACALPLFGAGVDTLATLANERVADAATMRVNVLRPALIALQGTTDNPRIAQPACEARASPFLAAFDRSVDSTFFEALFHELTAPDDAAKRTARRQWLHALRGLAIHQLATAKAFTPRSAMRRYQAEGVAEDAIESAFRRNFPNGDRGAA
ncbi:type I-E CRISPR-associated protein Cse1/CasA [Bradyrhizobium sp. ARR65]|uniref:type I-E CRISPR-associated protein Cse1/CasA n=1 Tax=Bradyrhizobium sp. ARR65 TaxID=1040989 RepID=UPI00046487DB|nr:type I-E CRISPR-associated protein Cse1/CasA [Bradyrhizobium sp. ARR65]